MSRFKDVTPVKTNGSMIINCDYIVSAEPGPDKVGTTLVMAGTGAPLTLHISNKYLDVAGWITRKDPNW